MVRILTTVGLLLVMASPAWAQKWVRGRIVDDETGEALAAVTVQVTGTSRGTITNGAGQFELFLERVPASLTVRHIGYRSASIAVTPDTPDPLEIRLHPVTYEMEGVVVSGEDPAVGIMRRVLAAKRRWRSGLASAYAEVYTRFRLYREHDLVQVKETIGASYWRLGKGSREVVRARRTRPRHSGTFRFAAPSYVPNLYDDDIEVMGGRYIGPTHPDALDVYTFTLTGRRRQDDRTVFDISFAPRGTYAAAFVGHLSVLDSAFAVLSIGMRPRRDVPPEPPVIASEAYFEQQFAPVGDSLWLPVDFHVSGSVEFGRVGVHYPRARYEQVSRLTLHAVNVEAPDSLFAGRRHLWTDPQVAAGDYLFRWNPGLIPLTPQEIEELVSLDERMTLRRAFRPSGFLRGYLGMDVVEKGPDVSVPSGGPMETITRNAWVWFNRVDGWHVGLRPRFVVPAGGHVTPAVGYDASRKRLSGGLQAGWEARLGRDVTAFVDGEVGDGTATRQRSLRYTRAAAGLARYAGFDDYFDYYRRRFAALRAGVSLPHAVRLTAGVETERAWSVARHNTWRGFVFKTPQRENPPIREGDLTTFVARVDVGVRPGTLLTPPRSTFSLKLAHSPGGAFTTVRGVLDVFLPTLVRRRRWQSGLALRVVAGTSRGAVPLRRFGTLDTALGLIGGDGAFRTRRDRPYEGERVLGIFWEHDFTSLPFEALGLLGLAERGMGLAVFGAHGRTWIARTTLERLSSSPVHIPRFHHEVGLSLTHLFRLPVRLDGAVRLDRRGFSITVGWYRPH